MGTSKSRLVGIPFIMFEAKSKKYNSVHPNVTVLKWDIWVYNTGCYPCDVFSACSKGARVQRPWCDYYVNTNAHVHGIYM